MHWGSTALLRSSDSELEVAASLWVQQDWSLWKSCRAPLPSFFLLNPPPPSSSSPCFLPSPSPELLLRSLPSYLVSQYLLQPSHLDELELTLGSLRRFVSTAHPGAHEHVHLSARELQDQHKRIEQVGKCDAALAKRHGDLRESRELSLARRTGFEARAFCESFLLSICEDQSPNLTLSPIFSSTDPEFQNTVRCNLSKTRRLRLSILTVTSFFSEQTCLLSPEVTEGPYYVGGEQHRNNMFVLRLPPLRFSPS